MLDCERDKQKVSYCGRIPTVNELLVRDWFIERKGRFVRNP